MNAINPLEYAQSGISLSQYISGVKEGLLPLILSKPNQLFAVTLLLQFIQS